MLGVKKEKGKYQRLQKLLKGRKILNSKVCLPTEVAERGGVGGGLEGYVGDQDF